MPKELVISAAPHETRVAILEDGLLCEIYIEREKEFALVGSIYKGRVTRVLPGMQSAFVDIGLDSDAFLYVGDFLENLEDYDHVVAPVEGKVQKMEQQGGEVFAPSAKGGAPGASGQRAKTRLPPKPLRLRRNSQARLRRCRRRMTSHRETSPPRSRTCGRHVHPSRLRGRTAVRADSDKARAARARARITAGGAVAARRPLASRPRRRRSALSRA